MGENKEGAWIVVHHLLPQTRLYLFTAIDDCTRIRVLKVYDRCNQRTAARFIDEVQRRLPFGIRVIQTDRRVFSLGPYTRCPARPLA